MSNAFKDLWIDQTYEKIKLVYPNDNKEDIVKYLSEIYDKEHKDNKCIIYNNYEKEEIHTTIPKLLDWLIENEPILTESGSMFKHHGECLNINSFILDKQLSERKKQKAKKFEYVELSNNAKSAKEKEEYQYKAAKADLAQLRKKVIANSEYGVSGLPSSWFFNMACASGTTAKGQALISTAFNAFEDFLFDNVLFMSMDECLLFINNIVNEKPLREKNDSKWVNDKTTKDVVNRLKNKFYNEDDCDSDMIKRIVSNLSQEDKNRIYYKSNLYEFILNSEKASQMIKNIALDFGEFIDPNNPPKYIKSILDKLRPAILEYVHYNHPTTDRVNRLKHHLRKAVIVIDTDSNFINLGPWVEFIEEELLSKYIKIKRKPTKNNRYIISSSDKNKNINRKIKEKEKFRIAYTMINILNEMIHRVLVVFGHRSNIGDNYPGTLNMKNEFLYDSILITPAKKHYQAAIRVQEGVYFETPKIDIKGMEYTKNSMAGESTRKFIKKLVYEDILMADNGAPNISKILKKLKKFENHIKKSVLAGSDEYLKTANIKTEDAYADPMSTGPYKAAYVWNYLYPDKQIELPGIARLVKVNMAKKKDFAQLSVSNPEIFEKLSELFDTNERISKSGISNIAIPLDEEFPKWLVPYINLDEIISNNLKLIYSILNCLGIKTIYKTKSTEFFSNVVRL